MPRAIALIRVSTDAQGAEDRAGLPAQRREIERIAATHGLDLAEWVELRGVSGAQVREDPRFVSLLARLAEPGIDGVAVADFDRLFRRNKFADYGILDAFADAGALLWTAEGIVDPRLESDALLSVIRGELAGMERRRIKERTMRAKEIHRRAGRHVAGPAALPFGVGYDKEAARWFYEPAKSVVVREAFRLLLGGERNLSEIARRVGIGRTTLCNVLRQPIYKGVRRLDHRKAGKRWVRRAPDEVIEQVVMEPLIPPEEWEAAQRILQGQRPRSRPCSSGVYRGLLVCGLCGASLQVRSEPRFGPCYRCRRGEAGHCWQMAQRIVDDAVDAVISQRLATPELIEESLAALAEVRPEAPDRALLEAELRKLSAERDRVAVGFERGLRSLEDAERRTREIDAQSAALQDALGRSPAPPEDPADLALRLAETFVSWGVLAPSDRRKLAMAAVEWVCVSKEGRGRCRVEAVSLSLPGSRPERHASWNVWRPEGYGGLVVPIGGMTP